MRTWISLALIFQFAAMCVHAGGLAGAYERILIFYVYQLDLLLDEKIRIFKPCKGEGKDGTCTFSNLMDKVDVSNRGKHRDWLPEGVAKDETEIPVQKTVDYIEAQKLSQGRAQIDMSSVLKKKNGGWVKNVKLLAYQIKEFKLKAGDSAVIKAENSIKQTEICLQRSHDLRIVELHEFLSKEGIASKFTGANLVVKLVKVGDGFTWDYKGAEQDPINIQTHGSVQAVRIKITEVLKQHYKDAPSSKTHSVMVEAESKALQITGQTCSK